MGIGVIRFRVNFSPESGAYVTVGRSVYLSTRTYLGLEAKISVLSLIVTDGFPNSPLTLLATNPMSQISFGTYPTLAKRFLFFLSLFSLKPPSSSEVISKSLAKTNPSLSSALPPTKASKLFLAPETLKLPRFRFRAPVSSFTAP
jgi:hypothetical protein